MRHPSYLLAALILTATSAYAAVPQACTLLTPEAASSVFGATVKLRLDGGMICFYRPANASGDTGVNINVIAMDGAPAGTMAQAYSKSLHKDYETDTVESVPGLGEQNRIVVSTHKTTIQVLYHDAILQLVVTDSKNPKLKAAMIEAAKQAIAKL